MDRITAVAAQQMLADLAENGGGTYERGTYLPFRPSSGFAVAIGGAVLPAADVTAEHLVFVAKAVAGEYMTSYVGTWLNDGKVYIDAVRYFGAHNRAQAVAIGQAAGQLAIFDFAAMDSITL